MVVVMVVVVVDNGATVPCGHWELENWNDDWEAIWLPWLDNTLHHHFHHLHDWYTLVHVPYYDSVVHDDWSDSWDWANVH